MTITTELWDAMMGGPATPWNRSLMPVGAAPTAQTVNMAASTRPQQFDPQQAMQQQAMAMAAPQAPEPMPIEKPDPWDSLMRAGLAGMAAAGVPGATTAGALGAGGLAGLDHFDQQKREITGRRLKARAEQRADDQLRLQRQGLVINAMSRLARLQAEEREGELNREQLDDNARQQRELRRHIAGQINTLGRDRLSQEDDQFDEQLEHDRWEAELRAGLTVPQRRTNRDIRAARRWLEATGFSPDELKEKLGSNADDILAFLETRDPIVRERWNTASQTLYGDDPEFDAFWSQFAPARTIENTNLPPGAPSPLDPAPEAGPPLPVTPGIVPPQESGGRFIALPQPRTRADYDALPHGAEYVAPDGSRRRKPFPTERDFDIAD